MKSLLQLALSLSVALLLVAGASAEDKKPEKGEKSKEVTLKGTLTCAKCGLKVADKCTNAIKVKDGDKEVVYLLQDNGTKEKYHSEICQDEKAGSVKGVVSEKDGKKFIKPSKDGVKFN